ncbi:MAG: hypothetical protein ACREXP_02695, partial [Steroidobacteraceae bacterium]
MSKRRAKQPAKPDSSDAPPTSAERIEAARQQIFKAMGVISVCRLGSESVLETDDCTGDMASALSLVHD